MADAYVAKVLAGGPKTVVVQYTDISDGTGLSDQNILDISTYTINGAAATKAAIQEVQWAIQGMTNVRIEWDHTTDETALILTGNGYKDFSQAGNLNSTSSGQTGDVLLTTVGAVATATFDIVITYVLS